MKLVLAIAGALALTTLAASAQEGGVTKYTITGRSAAAAVAQGVPLDQTPKPTTVEVVAPDGSIKTVDTAAAPAAPSADGSAPAASAPAGKRVVRYGLLGLSWRTE